MVSEKHLVDKRTPLLGSGRYKRIRTANKPDCTYAVFELPALFFFKAVCFLTNMELKLMTNLKELFRKQIAHELLHIRKEKGLSLTDVALQTDLALTALQNIENNSANYDLKKYMRLIRFYGKKIKISLE